MENTILEDIKSEEKNIIALEIESQVVNELEFSYLHVIFQCQLFFIIHLILPEASLEYYFQ